MKYLSQPRAVWVAAIVKPASEGRRVVSLPHRVICILQSSSRTALCPVISELLIEGEGLNILMWLPFFIPRVFSYLSSDFNPPLEA